MTQQKAGEDDVQGSQDKDDRGHQPPPTDKDNEGQSTPSSRATQVREMEDAEGDVSEGGGDVPLEDNTSGTQLPNASLVAQTPTIRNDPPKSRSSRMRISGPTKYCGIPSPRLKEPQPAARGKGGYYCLICRSRFTRAQGVNFHFARCVEKYGNPDGHRWNDDPSCKRKDTRTNDGGPGPANSAAHIDVDGEEEEEEKEEDGGNKSPAAPRYDPRTIASDVLRLLGEHPTLPLLNAHMEDRDLFSAPPADPSLRPRSRSTPIEATDPTHRHSHQQTQGRGELEKVDADQQATAADVRARREKEEAERNVTVDAEEHIISTTPSPPSQRSLDRNPTDSNTISQTYQASQLGAGWEMHRVNAGYVYFVNRRTGVMTFDDPRLSIHPLQFSRLGPLPSGWELCVNGTLDDPRLYYKDKNTNTKTWKDPRPPSS